MAELEETAIRERAHQLWEAAGKPEGKEEHFWLEAERQLKNERIRHELKTPKSMSAVRTRYQRPVCSRANRCFATMATPRQVSGACRHDHHSFTYR